MSILDFFLDNEQDHLTKHIVLQFAFSSRLDGDFPRWQIEYISSVAVLEIRNWCKNWTLEYANNKEDELIMHTDIRLSESS